MEHWLIPPRVQHHEGAHSSWQPHTEALCCQGMAGIAPRHCFQEVTPFKWWTLSNLLITSLRTVCH